MLYMSRGAFYKLTRLGALTLTIGFGSLLALGQPVTAATITFDLDFTLTQAEANVDNPGTNVYEGNKSTLPDGDPTNAFHPSEVPSITITARGNLDANDPFGLTPNQVFKDNAGDADDLRPNSIVLSSATEAKKASEIGLGVQEPEGGGSSGISGKGHEINEEVMFSFDIPVLTTSIILGLSDVCFFGCDKHDAPVLILINADGSEFEVFADHHEFELTRKLNKNDGGVDNLSHTDQELFDGFHDPTVHTEPGTNLVGTFSQAFAFNDTDGDDIPNPESTMGLLMFAALNSSFDRISGFILRETDHEIYITGYSGTVDVIPLPASLPLFLTGLASLYYVGRRKRTSAKQ